jgi:hypothetical protein
MRPQRADEDVPGKDGLEVDDAEAVLRPEKYLEDRTHKHRTVVMQEMRE